MIAKLFDYLRISSRGRKEDLFLREIIFVGKSLQTNLGVNLSSQKVCETSFVELICTPLPICKHPKIFPTNSFPIKPLIPVLCSTNILIYIVSN